MESTVSQHTILPATSESDLVTARHLARGYSKEIGLGLVDETKLVTAVSELTRNAIVHGGGGSVCFEQVERDGRQGVRVTFEDHGPGIPDVTVAMLDGGSSTKSLGLGLPGSRRLVDEFELHSEVGKGTKVMIVKWK